MNQHFPAIYDLGVHQPAAIVEQRAPQSHEEFMALMQEAIRHMEVINGHMRRILSVRVRAASGDAMSEGQFDPFGIVGKLHACMGDSCYCKPGNESKWRWSTEDKDRLMEAVREIKRRADERRAEMLARGQTVEI